MSIEPTPQQPEKNKSPTNIEQKSTGDNNTNVGVNQGNIVSNVKGNVTFNDSKILLISVDEIKTREFIKTSPYKGLKKFEPTDKDLFFGRNQFLKYLTDELELTNFILLLGASGSGKSSVIQAGLIPSLQKKLGSQFIHLIFTPDANPFESLYGSLLSKYSQKKAQIARESKNDTLTQLVKTLKKPQDYWFIFIDQFEELFTTSADLKRDRFIASLLKLSKNQHHNVKIVATMRADFFDRLSPYTQLVKATEKHRPMITEMQPDELRLAIEQPAAYHGVVFETGLVEEIIKDVQGQAGYLPLLQYTLDLLWETEVRTGSINDRTLNINTYRELGGVRGALQQHVNGIYEALSVEEKLAAQRIFLKLVGIGKDLESDTHWKPIRRRALRSEFSEQLEQNLLMKLINENLLVSNYRQLQSPESTIEIAHEILLTCWTTLNTWIQKNRDAIALRNRLYDDVAIWKKQKVEGELWSGSKLEKVVGLRKDSTFNQVLGGFSDVANQFIDASVGLRNHQRRRTIIWLSVFSVVAFILTALVGIGWWNAETRLINFLVESSDRWLKSDERKALKSSVKAAKMRSKPWIDPNTRTLVELTLLNTVHNVAAPNTLGGHTNAVTGVSFSPSGKLLASASADKTVKLWDTSTGKVIKTLKGHTSRVNGISFSPSGKLLASASADKTVKLWDTSTGKVIKTLKGHRDWVWGVSFSPSGKLLASASRDNMVKLWDTSTGKAIKTLTGHGEWVWGVSFSPDGKMLASTSDDGTVKLWNTSTGKVIKTLKGHGAPVYSASFSPDGKMLASVGYIKTVKLWDTNTGKVIKTLKGHTSRVYGISFSPSGKLLASASADGTVKLWDSSTGKAIKTLKEHTLSIWGISFSPSDKLIASASDDRTVKLWDTSTGKAIKTLAGHTKSVWGANFNSSGKLLASADVDGTVKLWGTRTGKVIKTLKENDDPIYSISFSPNGKLLASANANGKVKLWDTNTGKIIKTLKEHTDRVWGVNFSPSGNLLASASRDKTVKLWDTNTGKIIKTLKEHTKSVNGVSFSPSGKFLASASADGTVKLWDTNTGKAIKTLKEHTKSVNGVSFSPSGKFLASASNDGSVKLWDTSTGKAIKTITGHTSEVNGVSFSPNGKLLASASDDGTVKLWDTSTGKEIKTLTRHSGWVMDISFSPNGKLLASASTDKTVKLWKWDVDYLLQEGCNFIRRDFKINPPDNEEDKHLCDDISSAK